jgi:hypothetical protein
MLRRSGIGTSGRLRQRGVSDLIYNVLIDYRNSGKKYIDVIVDYPTNNSSTYGKTDL